MSPTLRAAWLLAVIGAAALFVPLGLAALAALALLTATVLDARSVRAAPVIRRAIPPVLSSGAVVPVEIDARVGEVPARVRQATPAGMALEPSEGQAPLAAQLVARKRGRHQLPELGVRVHGPLHLGAATRSVGPSVELEVYPDLVTARRLAIAVREGRLIDSKTRGRGPIGIGTDFESVREWNPDDDPRHINWAATQRLGRPMTNQYRLEQARDVVCVIDAGRLMATPLRDRTRLDAALDAVAAIALAADQLGDHCGAVAFDSEVRVHLAPRRGGGNDTIRALFDLQARLVDSDYEQAFRRVAGGKRALVVVLSDLFDEDAARTLIAAIPVLSRRHAVIIGTTIDPDLEELVTDEPDDLADVYRASAAVDLLDARARAAVLLRRGGARVVEAPPERLAMACTRAYLTAKATLRV